eukprot:6934450-Pyramimonas_sp.AAC.2
MHRPRSLLLSYPHPPHHLISPPPPYITHPPFCVHLILHPAISSAAPLSPSAGPRRRCRRLPRPARPCCAWCPCQRPRPCPRSRRPTTRRPAP